MNRWKLVSIVLAGCMSYSWLRGDAASEAFETPAVHARGKSSERLFASARMSKDEVLRRLFAARTASEIEDLAVRLGAIGDDAAIDAVLPLVHDPKCPAPTAIVAAFGEIATDHAVDALIELARSPRDDLRTAAAEALGETRNRRAEPVLIELANGSDDDAQITAIEALAQVATERGVEALASLANRTDDTGEYAMRALARVEGPAGRAAIVRLVDAPSLAVAANAIRELSPADLDSEVIAKLARIVTSGEGELASAALGALAKAGDAGFPTLREAALQGPLDVRIAAIQVLGDIDSTEAVATLRSILESEDGRAATEAARVLGGIDSDDAREALIASALADETGHTGALAALLRQGGPDVEQALLVIAKSGGRERWDAVEHLVRAGNADGLALAVAQARSGELEHRLAAMTALANAGTEPAFAALVELAQQGGDLKAHALALLGDARPGDPAVGKLLAEAVHSREPGEAVAAAAALANVGTPEARDALVAALASSDARVASSAVDALAEFRLTDDVVAGLRRAAAAHPELKTHVMRQLLAAGSPAGIELARDVLTRGTPDDAYRALSALEKAGTPAAVELIMEGMRVADPQVRAEAVSVIASTGNGRAAELVAGALRDPEPYVRAAAARTLASMGTPRARDALIAMTRSADEQDRQAAVASLRRFEDAESARRLTELVRDGSPSVAYSAIDALAARDDALAMLRGFLADPGVSADLRRQAATALSDQGISDPLVDELLADSDEE